MEHYNTVRLHSAIGYAMQLVAAKQGDDSRMAMAQSMMGQAVQNIQAIQHNRNAAESPHMVDVRGDKWWLGGRRGPGRHCLRAGPVRARSMPRPRARK